MPKKPQVSEEEVRNTRLEFRVWGKQRKARKRLQELATEVSEERVEDCYLLIDDPNFNAKVRHNKLKIKRLVAEDKGFERWVASKHRSADTAPSPFDVLFEKLDLDRLRRGKPGDLADAVNRLDPKLGVRAVLVIKDRTHYRVGNLRAEVTDIDIVDSDDVLRTLAIEGDDLDELVALRKKLGLRGEPSTPVHQAIEEHDS